MKVFDFDIKKGVYSFQFSGLDTASHAHPVVEIIQATNGTFSVRTHKQIQNNLVFAIIDSNQRHEVLGQNSTVKILMVESHNTVLSNFLKEKGIFLENGTFLKSSFPTKEDLFSEIQNLAIIKDLKSPADQRIEDGLQFILENELDYKQLIPKLTTKVLLSESRLSHLFKEHIGISIKKYLVWDRLRRAMHLYLTESANLTDVSLQSGFFDQAHLSNAFKNLLGISPSKAYNSRILQL